MCLLLFLLVCIVRSGDDPASLLYPYTLINTDLVCATVTDCYAHHNNSWCASGFLCLHGRCKAIPEFPCRATQVCQEENQVCLDTSCTDDSECDNQVFCDGVEVCRNAICIMDPQQPSCLYLGGVCDEMARDCQLPRAHQVWQKEEANWFIMAVKKEATLENNSTETTTTVNLTSLIIIGSVMGVIFIATLIALLTKATQSAMKPNKY